MTIVQRGTAMDGCGFFEPDEWARNPAEEAIASQLAKEEPGPGAALVLGALALAGALAARRR